MIQTLVKIALPIILIMGLIYVAGLIMAVSGLSFDTLLQIFIYLKKSMLSFDWLIPYKIQLAVITTFLITESSIMSFKVINWIIGIFNGSGSHSGSDA